MGASVAAHERLASGGALVLWLIARASGVFAQSEPTLYEAERAEHALASAHFAIDPHPEGKPIAFVAIVRDEVLLGHELLVPLVLPKQAPTWPNKFHWLSEESVVTRELLLKTGDRFDWLHLEESERNLRALGTFALVRISPVRAGNPDQVGLFVYTRDLWSLRLETPFSGTGPAFSVGAQLIERNFLGRNKQLAGRFFLDPKSYSLGEEYTDARVAGGDLALDEIFDVILNREHGGVEGTAGVFSFGSPYRTLSQVWSWTLTGNYAIYVRRQLQGTEVASYRPLPDGGLEACKDPTPECLRAVWEQRSFTSLLSGSYRRGERYKQTFSFGFGAAGIDAHKNPETALQPGQDTIFAQDLLPIARRQIYPRFGYDLWLPNFVVFENLSTYGQSESVRVGPSLSSVVTFPLRDFGSSTRVNDRSVGTDSITFSNSLGYVLADGKALAEMAVSASARLEDGRTVDQLGTLLLRGATPPWLLGRLVAYGSWAGRRHDTAHTQVTLGGDNGLRGFESGALLALGGSRLRGNLEYRSLPVVFESVHIGGVLFYDVGSVYTRFAEAEFHHSIGAGLRVLFPQFNHTPFRADFGVPLDRKGFAFKLSYGSDQAVPLTAADDLATAALAPR